MKIQKGRKDFKEIKERRLKNWQSIRNLIELNSSRIPLKMTKRTNPCFNFALRQRYLEFRRFHHYDG